MKDRPFPSFSGEVRMTRGDKWTLKVVLVIVAVVFPFRLWWDLQHPENWSPGSFDDPHIYLWGWAACAILIGWIAWRIVLMERNRKRRWRVKSLLALAETLVRQRRRDEARAVLKECEALLSKAKSR
jgi:hypothetical protein